MKKSAILLVALGVAGAAHAQTLSDALKFSQLSNYGTARSSAMGGAFGALGGDMSTMSTNPAGIGVFRKSEVSITPYLNFAKTESGGRSVEDASFQMGNMGAVLSFYSPSFDWKGFNFGISYTNLNNFNRKTHQYAYDSPSSFIDIWAADANANGLVNGDVELADMTHLIGFDEETQQYSWALLPNEKVNQRKMIKEDGYQGEYDFSFGTNYKDKLYLGATIGIQSVRYRMKSVYTEDALAKTELNYFNYNEYLKVNGVGTNFKFGIIYRPIPELRIGAAIHTPTFYNLTQRFSNSMQTSFYTQDANGDTDYSHEFLYDPLDYELKTPWRAIISLASVLGQKTIISADYEYVNYSSAKYDDSGDGYDYSGTNDFIKSTLRKSHNFRAGLEQRLNSILSLRAGYSLWGRPMHNENSQKIQIASAGFGLNFGMFYCDAAYMYRFSKDKTEFYNNGTFIAEPITNKYVNNEAKITLGVRF